jgi:hypothetical protein
MKRTLKAWVPRLVMPLIMGVAGVALLLIGGRPATAGGTIFLAVCVALVAIAVFARRSTAAALDDADPS